MTYAQPNSSGYAISGNSSFFRLKQPVGSAGDIWYSEQAGQAFAIGPDSDISQVQVSYYDPQNTPTFLSQFQLTPQRPFTGFVPARMDAVYAPSGRTGRVLFNVANIWDPNYLPASYSASNLDSLALIAPNIDVIQYFNQAPPTFPVRADRVWYQQAWTVPSSSAGGGATAWLVLPAFGRSYMSLNLTNRSGASVSLTVIGVNMTFELPGTGPYAQETSIMSATAIANNASTQVVVTRAGNPEETISSPTLVSAIGDYDAYVIALTASVAGIKLAPTKITLSDISQS